jgi:hypothetical protein
VFNNTSGMLGNINAPFFEVVAQGGGGGGAFCGQAGGNGGQGQFGFLGTETAVMAWVSERERAATAARLPMGVSPAMRPGPRHRLPPAAKLAAAAALAGVCVPPRVPLGVAAAGEPAGATSRTRPGRRTSLSPPGRRRIGHARLCPRADCSADYLRELAVGDVEHRHGELSSDGDGLRCPSFSLSDAPGWLSIDPVTGMLSAKIPAGPVGTFPFRVRATNGTPPDASHSFALTLTRYR